MKKKIIIILFSIVILMLVSILFPKKYEIKSYINDSEKDYVVLYHGIYGEFKDVELISESLKKDFNVITIQYPSTEDVDTITNKYIYPVLTKLNSNKKINFVVHSMGGIITRNYIEKYKPSNLGKVFFISPPSHGTDIADIKIAKPFYFILGYGLSDLSTNKNSLSNRLPNPNYECKVIVGNKSLNPIYSMIIKGKDDGMVPTLSAKLDTCEYDIYDGETHTSILKRDKTLKDVSNFLKN